MAISNSLIRLEMVAQMDHLSLFGAVLSAFLRRIVCATAFLLKPVARALGKNSFIQSIHRDRFRPDVIDYFHARHGQSNG